MDLRSTSLPSLLSSPSPPVLSFSDGNSFSDRPDTCADVDTLGRIPQSPQSNPLHSFTTSRSLLASWQETTTTKRVMPSDAAQDDGLIAQTDVTTKGIHEAYAYVTRALRAFMLRVGELVGSLVAWFHRATHETDGSSDERVDDAGNGIALTNLSANEIEDAPIVITIDDTRMSSVTFPTSTVTSTSSRIDPSDMVVPALLSPLTYEDYILARQRSSTTSSIWVNMRALAIDRTTMEVPRSVRESVGPPIEIPEVLPDFDELLLPPAMSRGSRASRVRRYHSYAESAYFQSRLAQQRIDLAFQWRQIQPPSQDQDHDPAIYACGCGWCPNGTAAYPLCAAVTIRRTMRKLGQRATQSYAGTVVRRQSACRLRHDATLCGRPARS